MNFARLRFIPLALAVAITTLPLISPQVSAEETEESTELELAMKDINGAWRKVRKQVMDPASNAETAALVGTMKKAAQTALGLTPQRALDVPEDQRAAFIAAYKVEMKKFVDLLGKLETALQENRNADAEQLVADAAAHQRSSHREYKRPDEG